MIISKAKNGKPCRFDIFSKNQVVHHTKILKLQILFNVFFLSISVRTYR